MTHQEARILISEIEKSGQELLAHEQRYIKDVRQRISGNTKIMHGESQSIQECYRRVYAGYRQDQPFKVYRRPVSKFI